MSDETPEGVALIDLRTGQCKWPITPHYQRYHRFCAAAVLPNDIYCGKHRKVASTPLRGHAQPQGRRYKKEPTT